MVYDVTNDVIPGTVHGEYPHAAENGGVGLADLTIQKLKSVAAFVAPLSAAYFPIRALLACKTSV